MGKDELREAEEEVLRVLQGDEEFSKPRAFEPPTRSSVPKPETRVARGIPVASALGYPAVVGIASVGGVLVVRQIAAMASLPLAAFSLFCAFLPGLIAGIADRFFPERVISPMRLAALLGFAMALLAFVLIYTLPIISLPSELQREIYPFGSTTKSMLGLGVPAAALLRAVNASIAAALGFGILFGILFARILSKKEV